MVWTDKEMHAVKCAICGGALVTILLSHKQRDRLILPAFQESGDIQSRSDDGCYRRSCADRGKQRIRRKSYDVSVAAIEPLAVDREC